MITSLPLSLSLLTDNSYIFLSFSKSVWPAEAAAAAAVRKPFLRVRGIAAVPFVVHFVLKLTAKSNQEVVSPQERSLS